VYYKELICLSNDANALENNRNNPIVNGYAPTIDGEYLNLKRTYMLRAPLLLGN